MIMKIVMPRGDIVEGKSEPVGFNLVAQIISEGMLLQRVTHDRERFVSKWGSSDPILLSVKISLRSRHLSRYCEQAPLGKKVVDPVLRFVKNRYGAIKIRDKKSVRMSRAFFGQI